MPKTKFDDKTRSALTNSILNKWNEQGGFIRFIDGNTVNCAITNLQRVSPKEAMENINSWKVDWDMELTEEEIALVNNPEWRRGLTFG